MTARCTLLDLLKAFDKVDNYILLAKYYRYALRGPIYSLLKLYLGKRIIFAVYNSKESCTQEIEPSVTQRTLLGPMFFLIYRNDLNILKKNDHILLFADVTNIFDKFAPNEISEDL